MHCKDVRPDVLAKARAEDWSFMDAVLAGIFTVPGDGAIAYAKLLKRLWPIMAMPAGWWWKRSRIPPRPIR